uniref:Uncharacterized protein n=1 Tax=Arundo donax TaxID=35708 RepID=A0A0A9AUK5_ARUDO
MPTTSSIQLDSSSQTIA